MKIMVTGGAGFIGSSVVDAYIEAGHDVAVVDNLATGKAENVNPNARFYRVDVRSDEIYKVFETERPEVVSHHAAQMSVPRSAEDPLNDADVNIMGFLKVLEAARRHGSRKIVFISSAGVIYGEPDEYPSGEDCRPRPYSPYAIAKSVAESYLEFYRRQRGIDYTVLRYSNIYGPRQIPQGEAGVVAIFMDRLLEGSACVVNCFKDEPRGMERDYCFVDDVVRANLIVLDKGSGEAYNIGTGRPVRTLELFESVYDAVKKTFPNLPDSLKRPMTAPARPGDLTRSCPRIGKAKDGLGWAPRVGLKEGIEATLEWRLKDKNLKIRANSVRD